MRRLRQHGICSPSLARIVSGYCKAAQASVNAIRLFEFLPRHPVITVASAMKLVEASKPTATRAIEVLVDAGILVESTGRRRDRSFAYQAYLDRLRVGTEI
jgi:Fic family protein